MAIEKGSINKDKLIFMSKDLSNLYHINNSFLFQDNQLNKFKATKKLKKASTK